MAIATTSGRDSDAVPGMGIDELDTPVLLVDLDRMERNIVRWQELADGAGMRLRVHVKTHKVPAIARMQLAAGACGIICAKVSEAEVFVDGGCTDVVVAYPVFGGRKWERLAALARRARVGVNVDSSEAVAGVAAAAAAAGTTVEAYVDVDTGMHRGGLDSASLAEISSLCRTIAGTPGVELAGVTTHRQLAYDAPADTSADAAGRDEGATLVGVADAMRADGHEIRVVAAGGSVSGRGVTQAAGVTELRAGTYVFGDLMQVDNGVAGSDDLALTALCTVVSVTRPGGATVDGGVKTFSGDHVAADGTYARAAGRGVVLERLSEEHGMARVGDDEVRLGERIRFHPVHVCTAVNLADELVGVRGGVVEVVWRVAARGRRT
jgi:D-serine deaminase-like pyridoxal phosphate-dependent protein